jgi:IS1 family transposase
MGFYKKKECNTNVQEEDEKIEGRVWIWTAIDVPTRLLISFNIGHRELEDARYHLNDVCSRLSNKPLFVSDELVHYSSILKVIFHSEIQFERTGKRGRPKNPILVVDDDLIYATVKKIRKNGHVTKVVRNVVYGTKDQVAEKLAYSPSKTINTSYVERSNGTLRLWDSHLTRKSLTFAKSLDFLQAKLSILALSYNFIKPHGTLSKQPSGKKIPTTPAMAAGITNRPWTYAEVLGGPLLRQ